MPEILGSLMGEFNARIRRYRYRKISTSPLISGLSDRDLTILELVYHKQAVTFAEITQELQGANTPRSSTSTISQTVSALWTKNGLVEKRPNPADQRQPIIVLTEKGKKVVKEFLELRRHVLEQIRIVMELDDNEVRIFENVFQRGINNLDKILADLPSEKPS